MKHILNNLSEQEKNAIREQHTGGMKVMTENFSRLLNSKLGDSKPLVNEQGVKINDIVYTVQQTPQTNKFRIFVTTPTYKTPTDAATVFGQGTMWSDYNTSADAYKAIQTLRSSSGQQRQVPEIE
jgi:hypothetical protein